MHIFDQNENIDPEFINSNNRELQTLVAQAVQYNKELRSRYDMISKALSLLTMPDHDLSSAAITAITDGYILLTAPALLKAAPGNTSVELVSGNLSITSAKPVESLLATSVNNMFNEVVPAAGTVITGNAGTLTHPELIFSPDAVWSQELNNSTALITATFPPGLSNKYNSITAISVLPYTSLTTNLSGGQLDTTVHVPETSFNNQLVLTSTGQGASNLHSIGLVSVDYKTFADFATITIKVDGYDDTKDLNHVELLFASSLGAQVLADIAHVVIRTGAADAAAGTEPIYDTASDMHPLDYSIDVGAEMEISITLKCFNNSSPLVSGLKLGFTQ